MKKSDLQLFSGFVPEGKTLSLSEQEHPLVRYGDMRIVWERESPVESSERFSIGTVVSSPRFGEAIDQGHLDPFFHELGSVYRDIYGGAPWNEYLVCTNRECARVIGIADVYGGGEYAPLSRLEATVPVIPGERSCSECSSPQEFFYPPEAFVTQLQRAFRERIIATFLFQNSEKLLGFSLGWETTVRRAWKDKFLIGYGDEQQEIILPYEEYREEVRRHVNSDLREDSEVYNSAEWAISVPGRSSGASLALYYANLYAAFEKMSRNGADVPALGHSLLGSKALNIFTEIGFSHGIAMPGSEQVRVYSTLQKLLQGICTLSERKRG